MALSYKPSPPSVEIPQSYYEAITRTGMTVPENPVFKGLTKSPADYEQSVDAIPAEIQQLNIARGLIQGNLLTRADTVVDNLVKSSLGLSQRVVKLHGKKILSQRAAANPILGSDATPTTLKEMSNRDE